MFILAISPGEGYDEARWSRVLASGIDGLMLREKQMETGALLGFALRVRDEAPGLELWVNGRLDVALAGGLRPARPGGLSRSARGPGPPFAAPS